MLVVPGWDFVFLCTSLHILILPIQVFIIMMAKEKTKFEIKSEINQLAYRIGREANKSDDYSCNYKIIKLADKIIKLTQQL